MNHPVSEVSKYVNYNFPESTWCLQKSKTKDTEFTGLRLEKLGSENVKTISISVSITVGGLEPVLTQDRLIRPWLMY